MMNLKKVIAYSVIAGLMFTAPIAAEAKGKPEDAGKKPPIESTIDKDTQKNPNADAEENTEINGQKQNEKDKAWIAQKDALEAEKDKIEAQKEDLENQKDELEKQLEAAVASGNQELVKELTAKLDALKADIATAKSNMKSIQLQMKEVIKSKYSQEELDALKELAAKLEKENPGVKTIPVENILSKKANFKFDTPPVIKQGRTLIPVRAITEGFGAAVDWNAQERTVTITKGDVVIVLTLNDGKAFVNGVEKPIDVPAALMNNRTIVPLRFIVENLGLKIDYDTETGTIEIDDSQDQTTANTQTTTDSQMAGTQTTDNSQTATQEAQTNSDTSTPVVVEPANPIVEVSPADGN